MKTLYIIRHAKSSWDNPALDDFDRPLNERGKKNTERMSEVLKKLLIYPDLVISSPAVRAFSTAKKMAENLNYPKEKIVPDISIYEAGIPDLLQVVNNISDQFNEVFLFGHNPGLTDFANYLCGAQIASIPTLGIVQISFPYDSWKLISHDTGELKLFDFPKNHE